MSALAKEGLRDQVSSATCLSTPFILAQPRNLGSKFGRQLETALSLFPLVLGAAVIWADNPLLPLVSFVHYRKLFAAYDIPFPGAPDTGELSIYRVGCLRGPVLLIPMDDKVARSIEPRLREPDEPPKRAAFSSSDS